MTAKHFRLLAMAAALCAAACASEIDAIDDGPIDEETGPGPASGEEDNTYDHPDVMPDVWELLERMQEEGPPKYQSRVHSCTKVRYRTIGNVLASLGVELGAEGEIAAGNMWSTSDQALGAPNYGARTRENSELTTASASKLFDIFVQAAPEIIGAMPGLDSCTVGGVPTEMFNDLDQCTPDGISCLLGVPATPGHVELCNEMVGRASDAERGKIIAVATLLAAGHTCE